MENFRGDYYFEHDDFHRGHGYLVINALMIYKHNEPQSIIKKMGKSKLTFGFLIFLLIMIGWAAVKQRRGQERTVNNMNALEQEIAKLEKNNTELSELVQYLESSDFVEREAREKLNMQGPGEKVVLVPARENDQGQIAGAETGPEKPNWQLWQEYFFGE